MAKYQGEYLEVIDLATNGLLTDGAHHKQWYLEQILIAFGADLDNLSKELKEEGYSWDRGIAP